MTNLKYRSRLCFLKRGYAVSKNMSLLRLLKSQFEMKRKILIMTLKMKREMKSNDWLWFKPISSLF